MKRATKKQCRILSLKRPREVEYVAESQWSYNVGTASELPDPHVYPLYGGECWRQAYDEMVALKQLILATQLWASAQKTTYMPQSVRDAFFVAYENAKKNYGIAWQVMEDCLVGMVA
jgi:hypothetical protein